MEPTFAKFAAVVLIGAMIVGHLEMQKMTKKILLFFALQIVKRFLLKNKNCKKMQKLIKLKERDNLDFVIGEITRNDDKICNNCELKNTHCEGLKCNDAAVSYFENLTPNEVKKEIFETLGKEYYYNLSLRFKLKLIKI